MSALRKLSQAVHLPGARRGSGDVSPTSPNSGTASPRRSIAQVFSRDKNYLSGTDTESETDSDLDNPSTDGMSKNAAKRQAHKLKKKEMKSRLSIESRDTSEERKSNRLEEARLQETEEMKARYGELPIMQSQTWPHQNRIKIETITDAMVGQEVLFRARVHHHRNMSQKLAFMLFRQQIWTIQGVLAEDPGVISPVMIHWAEHLRTGAVVLVKGVVQKPGFEIKAASIHSVEILVKELKVIAKREEAIPFSVQEAQLVIQGAEKVEGRQSQISDRTRLSNRILDLRTSASQSIFRIQSGVGNMFRFALDERGFIEIHSPKLQGAATESGASVFKVNYFGRNAFLAQSPQFAKQMAISADFERVYEIGAVFRAENSNTHRHLTEYTGLDIEMAIEEHYWECLDIVDDMLKSIFKGIYTKYRREVDIIKEQFPHEDLVWLEKTPRIKMADAIGMLNDSGWLDEEGKPLDPSEDFATRDEIRFGELMKEKYGTDYYIIDKFPRGARPFYAMPDPEDPKVTNSFDIFVRGQEIISGGQRVHDPHMLEDNLRAAGVDPEDISEYMDAFRWGAPPHAGIGIGLERIVMLILKLGNIRLASLFHRDPKSFPPKPVVEKLRHPDADTLDPVWYRDRSRPIPVEKRVMPPIEELIANYGDATSTSYNDEKFKIWRHIDTGAAVAYVPEGKYAIIPGDPLCDPRQFYRISSAFLKWLKSDTKLKPIWILIGTEMEDVLGERLGWNTLSPVAEERVDLEKLKVENDPEVARKIRKAQSEGLKIIDLVAGKPVPADVKERANKRAREWLSNRKGTQIHLSHIDLFHDEEHRRYSIAEDKDGTLCGIAVLCELAARHGMQAKYTLDFPNAPSGTIELITVHALHNAQAAGVKSVTFGGGAAPRITAGHHISGAKAKVLQTTYDAIVKQFNLTRKSEFREKMGATADPIYVAYPPHGLGSRGIKAIMRFFQDE